MNYALKFVNACKGMRSGLRFSDEHQSDELSSDTVLGIFLRLLLVLQLYIYYYDIVIY